MKYSHILLSCILFFHSAISSSSNIVSVLRFGDSLYLNKSYLFALNEYQRAFFFAGAELKGQICERMADCHIAMEDFVKARSYYDSAVFYSTNDSLRINIELRKTLSYILENNFGYALLRTSTLEAGADSLLQRKLNLYKGICYFGLRQFDEAYEYFLYSIPEKDTLKKNQLQQIFEDRRVLNRPNPSLALTLSIFIPGTGQIYAGDLRDGTNSILLLSGLFFLAVSSPPGFLVVIMPFLFRYYIGGVLNARQAALEKRNVNQSHYYRNLIEILLK